MAYSYLFSSLRRPFPAHAIAALATAAALAGLAAPTWAQQRTSVRSSLNASDLERAFWICDHVATTRGVGGSDAISCGVITEDLQVSKFNGDFGAMLAWWQVNKAAEHQKLATTGAVGSRGSAGTQR